MGRYMREEEKGIRKNERREYLKEGNGGKT
jgi:hypothetical protein